MNSKKRYEMVSGKDLRTYVIFWVLYLIFFTFQRYSAYKTEPDNETLLTSFLINLIYLPDAVIFTHFIVNYVNPKFYFRNRFKEFYLIFTTTVVLYPLVPFLIRILIVNNYIKFNAVPYDLSNYFATILFFIFGITILSLSKLSAYLKEEAVIHQKLDNERLRAHLRLKETELKLLKSQVHPHFLFNTLNNLYSLTLEKSDRAPDLIIRLGDMLSYIIYDGSSEKVPLSKEIDFIKSFIELQKLRYENCDIILNIDVGTENLVIAPMILHTFIDNSFKHGPDRDTGNPWIEISIHKRNGSLYMTVINSTRHEDDPTIKSNGIGISNAAKRLELIYPGCHELRIDRSENIFSVYLRIDL